MSVSVITTLHKDGYDLYGHENINAWANFFPRDWNIFYYSEKHKPKLDKRITVYDFDERCSEWENYYQEVKKRFNADINKDSKRKNWYKKALRWSFKMFALLDALKNINSRYIIWLDADVKSKNSPPTNWIESCLKNKCIAAQFEKIKAGGHIESGVLIIDKQHPDVKKIIDWIELGYAKYKILDEEKAWDGIWLAKILQTNTVSWNNLWMLELERSARPFTDDNLLWLSHKVGKRKFKDPNYDVRSGRKKDQELI